MMIDRRAPLSFTYRGHDAEHNAIDMRLFGHSLIGMERLLTDGLILIHEGREPRIREKAPVSLVVQAPYAGSVGVLGGIVPALGQLPLLWNYVTSGGAKATMEFVAYVLNLRGGRPAEAEAHKDAMIEQLKIMEAARDRADTRTHDTIRHIIDSFVGNNASRVSRAARQAVAPLGRTVDTLGIGEEEGVNGQIDAPMAEVIRENSGAIVGDQERFVVQVDGYQHHNRVLKIARPDGEGYIAAIVTDPAFDQAPNIYTEAAAMRAGLVVDAKKTFRDGRIERIHISNAVEIVRLT